MAFGAVDGEGFQVDEGDAAPAAEVPAAVAGAPAEPATPVEPAKPGPARGADGKFAATRKDPEPAENVEGDEEPKPAAAAKPADVKPAAKVEAKPGEKPEAEKRGKPRHDPEARIGQALERARLAEERAIRAEERARLFEEGRATPAPRPKPGERPAEVDDDPAPVWADYAGDEARYVDDKIAHGVRQALKAERAEAATEKRRSFTEQRHVERENGYRQRIDAAIKADPEFLNSLSEDVAELTPTHKMRPGERRTVWNAIADEIIDSEQSAALLVHLSANPDELQRLATLQPRALTRAMAILGHSLADVAPPPAATPKAQISQARPPVRPVEGAAAVGDENSLDDDAISDEEYRHRYNRQQLAQRRRVVSR